MKQHQCCHQSMVPSRCMGHSFRLVQRPACRACATARVCVHSTLQWREFVHLLHVCMYAGCSKTTLARAAASASKATLLPLSCAQVSAAAIEGSCCRCQACRWESRRQKSGCVRKSLIPANAHMCNRGALAGCVAAHVVRHRCAPGQRYRAVAGCFAAGSTLVQSSTGPYSAPASFGLRHMPATTLTPIPPLSQLL